MSRIGNKHIIIPAGVSITINEDNTVVVKGPKGEITNKFQPEMKVVVEDNNVRVERPNDEIKSKALHGTTRAVLNNMIKGVTDGFTKSLIIEGVGYRASLKGNTVVIAAGYSHLVELAIPEGVKVACPDPNNVTVSGIDKQKVGQFAAEIREVRKPEPYKGKGIRYSDEVIRRKEGKKDK